MLTIEKAEKELKKQHPNRKIERSEDCGEYYLFYAPDATVNQRLFVIRDMEMPFVRVYKKDGRIETDMGSTADMLKMEWQSENK